jgi:hypothetical protein
MRFLSLVLFLCLQLPAQTTALLPVPKAQFLDNSGRPLAGGKVYAYAAGTSTAQDTYTDSTGAVANKNPVILDAAGRAGIWLTKATPYKIVLTTSTGVQVWTVDNVTTAPLDTAFADQATTVSAAWNFTGTPTFQNVVINGTCTGTGCGGSGGGGGTGDLYALYVIQSGSGSTGRGGYIDLVPITYPNSSCFDAYGNPVNQPLAQTGYPAFGANDAILWVSKSPLAGVNPSGCATAFTPNLTYGLNLNTYLYALGGFATNQTSYNSFDSMAGGMHALSFSANNYINAGHHAGVPSLTANDSFNAGALFYDDTATCMKFYDGSTWTCIGSGGSGSPGGTNTNIQFNNSSTFGGSPNFTFDPATGVVALAGAGYFESSGTDGGFNATTSAHTDAIQALMGGVTAKWLIATDSVFWTERTAPPLSGAGQARVYADSGTHTLKLSQNGGAYSVNLATNAGTLTNGNCVSIDGSGNFIDAGGPCTTGGGGGTVASALVGQIAYYTGTGTTVGGNANLTWDPALHLLNVTTATAVAGINVTTGFVQSDGGFQTSSTSTNAIQVPSGGSTAKWLTATDSVIWTEETVPALSAVGQVRVYADSGAHSLKVSRNGGAYADLGGLPSSDATAVVYNSADNTKMVKFDASGITTGTTRIYAWPNANMTVAGLENAQTFTGVKTWAANQTFNADAMYSIGTPSAQAGAIYGRAIQSSKFQLQDNSGSSNLFWYFSPVVSGISSFVSLIDNGGGTPPVTWYRTFSGIALNRMQVDMEIVPATTEKYDLGNMGPNYWRTLYLSDSVYIKGVQVLRPVSSPTGASLNVIDAAGTGAATFDNGFWTSAGGIGMNGVTAIDNSRNGYLVNLTVGGTTTFPITGSTQCLQVNSSGVLSGTGAVCGSSGGGGITSINGLGGPAITITAPGSPGITVSSAGTNVALSLPQGIATTSAVTFASVTTGAGGAFNSGAAGTSVAFQTTNYNLMMNGNGDISAHGDIALTGSGSLKIGSTTAIDSSRNGLFVNLTAGGTTTLAITGSTQCLQANSSGVVSGTGSPCVVGSSYLALAGGTMTGTINGNTTASIGGATTYFQHAYFSGTVEASKIRTIYGTPSSLWDYFDWSISAAHLLNLTNSVGSLVLRVDDYSHVFAFSGGLYPMTSNSFDLGVNSTNAWRTLYLNTSIVMNGTQFIDSSRNLTNIGTISTSGAITAGGGLSSTGGAVGALGYNVYSAGWYYGLTSQTLTVGNGSGGFCTISVKGGIIVASTC